MIQIIYNPTKVLLSEHVSRSVNERLMVFSQFFPAWVYHTMLQHINLLLITENKIFFLLFF